MIDALTTKAGSLWTKNDFRVITAEVKSNSLFSRKGKNQNINRIICRILQSFERDQENAFSSARATRAGCLRWRPLGDGCGDQRTQSGGVLRAASWSCGIALLSGTSSSRCGGLRSASEWACSANKTERQEAQSRLGTCSWPKAHKLTAEGKKWNFPRQAGQACTVVCAHKERNTLPQLLQKCQEGARGQADTVSAARCEGSMVSCDRVNTSAPAGTPRASAGHPP